MTDPIRVAAGVLGQLRHLAMERRAGRPYAATAMEIGIGKATLLDFEKGGGCSLETALKIIQWVAPPRRIHPTWELLTPAARRFLGLLRDADGLGQAWLRIESGYYGLVIPDAEGTIGELHYAGRFTKRTVRECSPYFTRGVIDRMPPYRGPKNRTDYDHGHPIELTEEPGE